MLTKIRGLGIFVFFQIFIGCITFGNSEVVRCAFQIKKWDEFVDKPYTCAVMNLNSPTKFSVDKVTGRHRTNNANKDVKALEISNQHCEYFPGDFNKIFQNLEALAVVNSKLKSIKKKDLEVFPKLKTINFAGNELKTLPFALLSGNQQLKKISFSGNPLLGIGNDLMDNHEGLEQVDLSNAGCIDSKGSNADEIDTIKEEIGEKCPPTDDMRSVQETDMKFYFCRDQLDNATTALDVCNGDWETCTAEYEKQADQLKEVQTQLDQCSEDGDSKECEAKVIILETQAGSDVEEIKKLKDEIVKLKEEQKNIQNIYDREVLKLQTCKSELKTCSTKPTPKPSGGSETTPPPCESSGMKVIIECDKFYGTTCVSEGSLIPFEGMTMGGVKLPNGTVIDGSSITELYLSGGAIRAIPDDFGKYFTNLITLVMDSVRVEEINKNAFSGSSSLTNVTVTNGKLTKIHKNAFSTATNIVTLDFTNNLLTEIGEAIQKLTNLQTLIVESNQIKTVEWNKFKNMPNIEVISINKNPLEHVDSGFLDTEIFTNLVSVDMSGSKCVNLKYPATSAEKIKQALHSGCPFKVQLQCDFKQAGKDYVCEAKETFIYYENTIISSVTGTHILTKTVTDVTKVVINNQTVHYIPPNLTKQFGKLTKLEIDNSGLTEINHLIGLKEIVIINNNIPVIKDHSFKGSPDAEIITISGNKIQEITDGAFEENNEVETFDISNNNIATFTSTTIKNILTSANTVILSGNNFTSINWPHVKPIKPQVIIEDNPCIDMKSGKNYAAFVKAIQDGCSVKNELECEFKYIDEDYVCIAKNLNITAENTKITRVHGYHTESGLSSKSVTKIIIANQNMEYFPNNIAEVFPSLEKVEVTSSNLKKITKAIGQNLVWIMITGNQITKIEEDSFTDSSLLNYIDISNNEIMKIPKNIFEKNFELFEVNFSHNRLETINWSIFSTMTTLHTIDISYNKIKQIDWSQLTEDVENIDLTGNECINMKYSVEEKDKFMTAINTKCGAEILLTCKYKKVGADYVCYTVNLEIINENTRITGVEGKHLAGKSNKDVTRFVSINQKVVYFPINIRKFFTTLKVVDIISKTFKLRVIFISDTEFTKTSN